MGGGFIRFLLFTLIYSVISVCCCSPRVIHTPPELSVPEPKLNFPGSTELAVKSSEDSMAVISEWTSKLSTVASFIPGGDIVGKLLEGASAMTNLLSSAETEVTKLIEHKVAKATLRAIQAKLKTVTFRLEEVERYTKAGKSIGEPIREAAMACEEILLKFSSRQEHLLDEDNVLFTAPSVVAFAGIYAGVAGFKFQLQKLDRQHVVDQMKILKGCVEEYRESTIRKRLSYVHARTWGAHRCCVGMDCEDDFRLITSCPPCLNIRCTGNPDPSVIPRYKTSLEQVYRRYFDEPLSKLDQLIETFEKNISN